MKYIILMLNVALPYMGSKRKIAPKILDYIVSRHGQINNFYDLFGGGGAISFLALQHQSISNVHYNEFDPAVCALLQRLAGDMSGEPHELGLILPDIFYEWVSRETFFNNIDGTDWYAGLCRVVWSFGNNGKGYLFGKNIEESKHIAHMMAVYRDEDLAEKYGYVYEPVPLFGRDLKAERLCVVKHFKNMGGGRSSELERLQQLEQLQQLERLQQLQQLEQLEIRNLSYENVPIKQNSIIYCDPPYANTASYKNEFNHDRFNEWFANLTTPAYMSEYDAPFECVLEIKHHTSISQKQNNPTLEKLFWNGK